MSVSTDLIHEILALSPPTEQDIRSVFSETPKKTRVLRVNPKKGRKRKLIEVPTKAVEQAKKNPTSQTVKLRMHGGELEEYSIFQSAESTTLRDEALRRSEIRQKEAGENANASQNAESHQKMPKKRKTQKGVIGHEAQIDSMPEYAIRQETKNDEQPPHDISSKKEDGQLFDVENILRKIKACNDFSIAEAEFIAERLTGYKPKLDCVKCTSQSDIDRSKPMHEKEKNQWFVEDPETGISWWYPASVHYKNIRFPMTDLDLLIILMADVCHRRNLQIPAISPLLASQQGLNHNLTRSLNEEERVDLSKRGIRAGSTSTPFASAFRYALTLVYGKEFIANHTFCGMKTNKSNKIGLSAEERTVVGKIRAGIVFLCAYGKIPYTVAATNPCTLFNKYSDNLVNTSRVKSPKGIAQKKIGQEKENRGQENSSNEVVEPEIDEDWGATLMTDQNTTAAKENQPAPVQTFLLQQKKSQCKKSLAFVLVQKN